MARADLVSAALRHARDAEHLATVGSHQSLDQAVHLAGFASECIRKGCLDESVVDKALGHDIRDADDPIVDFLLAYDTEAHRYGADSHSAELPLTASHWRPDVRYKRTGSALQNIGSTNIIAILQETRLFVDQRVLALWGDGAIGDGALQ